METNNTPPPAENKPKARQLTGMRVAHIVDHTPRIRELYLTLADPSAAGESGFKFRSGQFVMLHVPAEPKALLRAYSLASDDRDTNGFQLIFNYVDEGAASKYVWSLKGGEILNFTGPFGKLYFREPPTQQIVMLNTGSGISQHLCYLLSNREKYADVRYRLLFGVRTEKDIYYQAELDELVRTMKDFRYEFVLSRPSPEWKGKKGYVQDFIGEFGYMEQPTTFYLCGNKAMILATKALLQEKGFALTDVLAEAFD